MQNLPTPLQAALAPFAPRTRISELKREALSGKVTGLFDHPLVLDGKRPPFLTGRIDMGDPYADVKGDGVRFVGD